MINGILTAAATETVPTDGTATPVRKKRTWSRRPKTEGRDVADGGAIKRRRRRKPAQEAASVFGAHTAAFTLIQGRARIAEVMKTHLNAMREEFGQLDAALRDVCNRVLTAMARSGMDSLQESTQIQTTVPVKEVDTFNI